MEHVESIVNNENDMVSVGMFSIIEGAVLYSAFAFLKHYRNGGKNLLKNLVSGINASVRDENLHSLGGAWLYNLEKKEIGLADYQLNTIEHIIREGANSIFDHECRIIDMLFEKGPINGITAKQLKNFVASRIDICLSNLGIEPIFVPKYNPIADWFYDGINSIKLHDFFNVSGNEYHRNWNMEKFNW